VVERVEADPQPFELGDEDPYALNDENPLELEIDAERDAFVS